MQTQLETGRLFRARTRARTVARLVRLSWSITTERMSGLLLAPCLWYGECVHFILVNYTILLWRLHVADRGFLGTNPLCKVFVFLDVCGRYCDISIRSGFDGAPCFLTILPSTDLCTCFWLQLLALLLGSVLYSITERRRAHLLQLWARRGKQESDVKGDGYFLYTIAEVFCYRIRFREIIMIVFVIFVMQSRQHFCSTLLI